MDYSITAPAKAHGNVWLPASKSISNRVLVINALQGGGCQLDGLAQCDDVAAMQQALRQGGGNINVGAAGTAMRFLTTYFATRARAEVTLDGTTRMRQRPIAPLVDALRQLGASISYLGSEGYPPLRITGKQLHGGKLAVDGSISSQYITALLLIAPIIGGMELELTGSVTSRPYIDLTLSVMRDFGADATFTGNTITVPAAQYQPRPYHVEADWSAASYWMQAQAVLPGSRIALNGLRRHSMQGDRRALEIFERLGVAATWHGGSQLVLSTSKAPAPATRLYLDLAAMPDVAQTLAVTMCLLGRQFTLTGLHTLFIKETNRLAALQTELAKLGYTTTVDSGGSLAWDGSVTAPQPHPCINTYADHRMAMAFAPAAARFPGLVINDAQVVSKSYPSFWQHLAQAGFTITAI